MVKDAIALHRSIMKLSNVEVSPCREAREQNSDDDHRVLKGESPSCRPTARKELQVKRSYTVPRSGWFGHEQHNRDATILVLSTNHHGPMKEGVVPDSG